MTLVTPSEVTLFLNTAGESWTTGPHCSSSGPCFVPVLNFLNYTLSVCPFACHSIHAGVGRQLLRNSFLLPPRGCWVQGKVVRLGWHVLLPTEPSHHPYFCFGSKIWRVYLVDLALTCVPGWPPGCWDGGCGPQPICPRIPSYHSFISVRPRVRPER